MPDVTIAVDAMGGDRAPGEVVAGALAAAAEGIQIALCGPSATLERELGGDRANVRVVDAPDVIGSHEEPAPAVRAKPGSSLVTACRLVREGEAQGAVSAGSTGAMMAASLVYMGRIRGINRPGIAVALPTPSGPCVLIDCGANALARPEHLLQFGIIGSEFAREVLDVQRPRVGLLSIGEESSKGTPVTLEAHTLLAASTVEFAGNCEGRDVLTGDFDVVVCDGFAGNVLLKGLEGAARLFFGELRGVATSSLRAKMGAKLLYPALRELRVRTDPDTYGGAYLLGVRGLSVIAHGNSSRRAIANAISHAARGARADVVERMSLALRDPSDLQSGFPTRTVPRTSRQPEIGDE
ncbi:MAG: phosphate acyltransferase PlsX [Gaiellales bacterium]